MSACEWCCGDAQSPAMRQAAKDPLVEHLREVLGAEERIAGRDQAARIAILPCGHLVCVRCLWGAVDARRLAYKIPDENGENPEDLADIDMHTEPGPKLTSLCICGASFGLRAALRQATMPPLEPARPTVPPQTAGGPPAEPSAESHAGANADANAEASAEANATAGPHAGPPDDAEPALGTFRCDRCPWTLEFRDDGDVEAHIRTCAWAVGVCQQMQARKAALQKLVDADATRGVDLGHPHDAMNGEIARLFDALAADFARAHSLLARETAARERQAAEHRAHLFLLGNQRFLQRHADLMERADAARQTLSRMATLEAALTGLKLELSALIVARDAKAVPRHMLTALSRRVFHARRMAHVLEHCDPPKAAWAPFVSAPRTLDRHNFPVASYGHALDWAATFAAHAHRLVAGPLAARGTTPMWLARDQPDGGLWFVQTHAPRYRQWVHHMHIAPDGGMWFTRYHPRGRGTRKLFRTDPRTRATVRVRIGGQMRILAFVIAANGLAVAVLTSRPPLDGHGEPEAAARHLLVATTTHGRVWQVDADHGPPARYVPASLTAINAREVAVCAENLFEVFTFDADTGAALRSVLCRNSLLLTTLPVLGTPGVVVLRGPLTEATARQRTDLWPQPVLVLGEHDFFVQNWRELLAPPEPQEPQPVPWSWRGKPFALRPPWFCSNAPAHILACGELRVQRPGKHTDVYDLFAPAPQVVAAPKTVAAQADATPRASATPAPGPPVQAAERQVLDVFKQHAFAHFAPEIQALHEQFAQFWTNQTPTPPK